MTQLGLLGTSLAQHDQAADSIAARRAASAAVGAIDAMLRAMYRVRGRLVQQIRAEDDALLWPSRNGGAL